MLRHTLPVFFCCVALQAAEALPKLVRIYPLGGQAGTSVPVEILGDMLANATGVEFDCGDLVWSETAYASHGKLRGLIKIGADAAPGPHILRASTLDGPSTSLLFNVSRFASVAEVEPNDVPAKAQEISRLPIEVQGRLDGAPDMDLYAIHVRAGERWLFDVKSIEQGSAVEARLLLLDAEGRQIHFNDDRGDYDENPLVEHTFQAGGKYFVKLDQYRGPRGFNFGKNCSYILRISQLPVIRSLFPLGLERGKTTRISINGGSLERTKHVFLSKVRLAEYAHMTYPYTMPISFRADSGGEKHRGGIPGTLVKVGAERVEVEFSIPAGTEPGLWKIWIDGAAGLAEGGKVEVSAHPEYLESNATGSTERSNAYAVNGKLAKTGEIDNYSIRAIAGRSLHIWTLASQLGVPYLDSVLRLRDASGKKVAESDDVVAGQGTLIGNPDSSLYYTPEKDEDLRLEIFDRLKRGGDGFEYRLKVSNDQPSFQLFTTPENFAVTRGGTGEIKVHLVREAGFAGEVSVWIDGLPPGVKQPKGKFRADQLFEPNADGADMVIPEITFQVEAPLTLAAGNYPIRLFGCRSSEETQADQHVVEGHTAMMLGPLLDVWNFVRRPLPSINMTVLEPMEGKLVSEDKTLRLEQGKTAELTLKLESSKEAGVEILDLPPGVLSKSIRKDEHRETFELEATDTAEAGIYPISAVAKVGERRVSTPLVLTVHAPSQ